MRVISKAQDCRSQAIKDLYKYWADLSAGRPAPEKAEIDPAAMPRRALPYVLLIDYEPEPFRIKYRLVGTHGVDMYGMEFSGKYLDELEMPGQLHQLIPPLFQQVIGSCEPLFGEYDWPDNFGGTIIAEWMILPLLENGKVAQFLCAEHLNPDKVLFPGEMMPLKSKDE